MTSLLFYQKPVPLNRDQHRHTLLEKNSTRFDFAQDTNSVPIAAVEFADTAREYPVVFAGDAASGFFPIALLGVRNNENLFVTTQGDWSARYVPAFVRRYPFVLAERPAGTELDVYIDEAFAGLNARDGDRLFTDTGEETPRLKQTLQFLSNYQDETRRTRQFSDRLKELEVLQPRALQIQRANQAPISLQGFCVVDEQRLAKLTDAQVSELFHNGFLSLIYAHLLSLGNVARLEALLGQRIAAGA